MAENHTTRNVVVAGGALAVFLLLFRGSGWGLGGSGGASHSGGDGGGWFGFDDAALHPLFVIHMRATSPRGDHYFVGTSVADARTRPGLTLLAVVEEAKRAAASGARIVVHTTGDARQGDFDTLRQKLDDARVPFSILHKG